MTNTLFKLNKENKEIYICGDFNINLLKYDEGIVVQEFYNLMTSNGCIPQITLPTRITDCSMTLIDNIYSNRFLNNTFSGNIIIEIADHLLQFVSIDTSKIEYNKFKYYFEDVNDSYNDFIFRLEGCVNRHAPIQKLNQKEQKRNQNPWLTNEILKRIKHRNKLFAQRKSNPSDVNIKRIYVLFRNAINRDINDAKKSYWTSYFDQSKNDMKKTWKGIRQIVNIKNPSISNTTQINLNGTNLTDPTQIANAFNNLFVNVGSNTGRSIPISFKKPATHLKNRIPLDFIIAHTSDDEILKIILSLDESKSNGPSSIPGRLLKTAAPYIILPLCKLINFSFHTGVFPDSIKVAKVVPTFKSGSSQDINNYRPISLLSVFSKIIEIISKNVLTCLYYSLVYTFLIYAIPIWGIASEKIYKSSFRTTKESS